MNCNKIACFDVYYHNDYAKASCLVFVLEPSEKIISSHYEIIKSPSQYILGQFYKRELPCLLKVYEKIKGEIDLAIIDGFVYLQNGEKGLGTHFYYALNQEIPIIGVAKVINLYI